MSAATCPATGRFFTECQCRVCSRQRSGTLRKEKVAAMAAALRVGPEWLEKAEPRPMKDIADRFRAIRERDKAAKCPNGGHVACEGKTVRCACYLCWQRRLYETSAPAPKSLTPDADYLFKLLQDPENQTSAPAPGACTQGLTDKSCRCEACKARFQAVPLDLLAPEPESALVEVALICPTCRRDYGHAMLPTGIPPVVVCAGCIREGRA